MIMVLRVYVSKVVLHAHTADVSIKVSVVLAELC